MGAPCDLTLSFSLCTPFPLSRLALYVYEYLLHVGAQKSAQTFLSEVSGTPLIIQFLDTPSSPLFLEPLFSGAATVATILNFYHLLAFIVSWSKQPFGSGKPPSHFLSSAPLSCLCSLLSRFDGKKTSRWENLLGFCTRGGGKFV